MVEANTIRGCLTLYGVSCHVTRAFLTGQLVGLDTAQAFVEMNNDAVNGVMKSLAEAARDKHDGAQPDQAGNFPFIQPAARPKSNVAVKNALACMTFAMQCLSQRGMKADEDMVTAISHAKARRFYHQAMLVKKDKAGTDSNLELSVLPARTQPNTTLFRKWDTANRLRVPPSCGAITSRWRTELRSRKPSLARNTWVYVIMPSGRHRPPEFGW